MREFIEILPAQQRYGDVWYRGTADAIYQNIYVIDQEKRDFVLILAGDHIYKMDYSKMLAFHLEKEADVTVGVVEMPIELSHQFGVLQVDDRGCILDFQEKPENPSPVPGQPGNIYASMGIYIFNRKVLLRELIQGTENNDRHDFGQDILPQMLGQKRMYAYRFVDENRRNEPYWRDIGTLDAFYEANMDLVSIDPQFNLYDDRWPIRTNQRLFPPAKTVHWEEEPGGRRGEAFNSLLSGGVIVSGGRVFRSILSPLVRINSHALVEDSVLMDGVQVGRGSRIRRTIIDKNVRLEPDTTIGWDLDTDRKRFTVTENGVVVIPRYRLIGPDRDEPLWVDSVDYYRQSCESGEESKPQNAVTDPDT
jgi:glucose-1-phosphate adenylyltransferase